MIYADNAATTRISDLALEKMLPFFQAQYGNASSQYSLGVQSKRAVERARKQAAEAVGCEPSEIIFTSGGSEGNSWVLQSVFARFRGQKVHIITSSIEHPSILNACRSIEELGAEISWLPVDGCGCVSVSDVEKALRPETKLVSIMTANNVIGTIQPIAQIGALLRARKILFHTDAVQAVGHLPIDVNAWNVDFLTASAHKFHGLKGTGFLYIRKGLELPHYIFGGEQEQNRRAGTENVPGIVALGYALEECGSVLVSENTRLRVLVGTVVDGLKKRIPGLRINAENVNRLPGLVNLTFPNASGEALMHLLDLKGICVSTSSACNSGKDEPSHVHLALGLTERQAKSSIRLSFGKYNTMEDVSAIVEAVASACTKIG